MPDSPPVRVSRHYPLWFEATACLPLRHRGAGCAACEDICPVRALSLQEYEPAVSRDCTGCGQCAAVCPMGALVLGSLPAPRGGTARGAALEVECEQGMMEGSNSQEVSCLGALDAAWLIEAHRVTGDGPLLVDRGQCADCPSSIDGDCPVERELTLARDLLEDMGVALQRLPRRIGKTRDRTTGGGRYQVPGNTRVSRRAFLTRLGRDAGDSLALALGPIVPEDSAAAGEQSSRSRLALPPRASGRRTRLLEACRSMVGSDHCELPRRLFRSARIGDDCCHRGLCRLVCPSGALTVAEAGEHMRVSFEPETCISCGACVAACPQQAFELHEHSFDEVPAAVLVAVHESRRCRRCGTVFTPPGEGDVCDPCLKSQELTGDLFRRIDHHQTTEASAPGGL